MIFSEELQTLRESENRHKLQYDESQRRERILIRKLALKEQEIQDYVVKLNEILKLTFTANTFDFYFS